MDEINEKTKYKGYTLFPFGDNPYNDFDDMFYYDGPLGAEYSKEKTTFRVWAPNAVSVSVVGDFNEWNRNKHPMTLISDGVWEVEISKLERYDIYKYSIETKDGRILLKSDPYGTHFETRPGTASKI